MTINIYFWLALSAVVGFWLLDLLANWLNLHALKPSLPNAFKSVYDEAEYRRMVEYTRARTRFEALESSLLLAVFLGFWFLGGYDWLDRFARSFQQGTILTGLIFFGILALGQGLIGLPFSVYGIFGIEQRFGFNKTTPNLFAADLLKSLLIGCTLGGGLLALLLRVFEIDSPSMWLFAWGATTLFMLLLTFLAPAILLPLFNKFTPLPEGNLKRAILAYAHSQQFPVAGLYVMDGSKRSTKANAFFTGLGKMKKIALFDTLIADCQAGSDDCQAGSDDCQVGSDDCQVGSDDCQADSDNRQSGSDPGVDELVAVLAHEVGHFKHRHILQHLAFSIINLGFFFFLAQHCLKAPGLFAAFGIQTISTYAGLALFLLLFKPLNCLYSLLQGIQSRRHEFQADRFAAETTGHPEAMIRALKKLSKNNLSNLAPHPLYVALYHSHPPLLKRIEAIGGQTVDF